MSAPITGSLTHRGRVLVVDDDLALAEMLGIVLRGEGFEPVFCADGEQALQVPVRGRIVANNGVALTEAAARGMGLVRQPDFIAAPFLDSGRVQRVLRRYEPAPLGIYAVLPSNRYIPHRVNVLIEHLARVLGPRRSATR